MITLRNPENGAMLTKYTFNKLTYRDFLKVGEQKAVLGHQRGHKGEPIVEEGKEFITPQERQDAEKKARFSPEGIPEGEGVDKDGVAWYGEGLTTDDEFMSVRRGK